MQCLHLGSSEIYDIRYTWMLFSLSRWGQISLCVLPEGVVHECGNIVPVIIGLFDMSACAVVIPPQLLAAKHDVYVLHW